MEFTKARIGMNRGVPRMIHCTGPVPENGERAILLREGMDRLAEMVHQTTRGKGFWDHEDTMLGNADMVPNPSIVPEKLALIHSEVSEALEAFRAKKTGDFEEELADTIIRVLDLAAYMGFSMDMSVRAKMQVNEERVHLHGKGF